ncbi:primosomal protein N', partial [Candidatus Saccharibacteria bacterium]|nr:primosomal protein N' [Candidatus Saccharibacteria bacterium]
GTKAVVDEVRRLFPEARIVRFDTDTERHEQLETQHEALQSGAVDIIIGTQMITKGLDLPKLSVVGVLNADSSLLVPDYTSNERTYQLLTQVIGRANRGHRSGHVIVQSYAPNHPVIEAAAGQDWTNFYANELAERQAYRFPPFVYLLKLTCVRAKSQSAESAATKLRIQIQKSHPRLNIEGPAAAFHPRENGQYKWQLIIKAASRRELIEIINDLPSGWSHDLDPVNLL